MSGLRFSLAQLNPTLGDLDGNIALIDQAARAAHADHADFVIFSELALTAYAPGDILQESDFLARCAHKLPKILHVLRLPFCHCTPARARMAAKWGAGRFFAANAAAFLQNAHTLAKIIS